MGLCGTKEQPIIDKPVSNVLTVWGDYFSPETRTIMVILSSCDVKHELNIVDQFQGDHKKEKYLQMNPTGSHPTI